MEIRGNVKHTSRDPRLTNDLHPTGSSSSTCEDCLRANDYFPRTQTTRRRVVSNARNSSLVANVEGGGTRWDLHGGLVWS